MFGFQALLILGDVPAKRGHPTDYDIFAHQEKMNYRHGGSPQLDLARFGLVKRPVSDFSVSLNPLGPPQIIQQKWPDLFDAVENYPSLNGSGLIRYYEEKFGILAENIVPGNGSTELIYLIPRALKLKKIVICTPCYNDYEQASVLAGARVFKQPLSPPDNFEMPSLDKLITLLDKVDSLWIGRPNNPTGAIFTREDLLELSARFPDKWFIVDEAFIQFLENWHSESLITAPFKPNILVIHSLTKFYSLAGLRLGAVVGHRDIVSRIKRFKEPWTINGIAERCAPLLLECPGYEHETRSLLREERSRAFQGLSQMDGVKPFGGTANFILCQWNRTPDLDDLLRHLLVNGACVRDCRNFPGLESNFFRIGFRTPSENARLLSLLGSYQKD